MKSRTKTPLLAAIGVPLLFVALIALQFRIDASVAKEAARQQELLLPSGKLLKQLSLGYDALLADIYWTRAVQYYGSNAGIAGVKFPLLWPLLDITTTLDPHLTPAYRFGSVFLSEESPVGAGEPKLALKLTEKGLAANPKDWQMNATIGFLYYWYLKDYQKSSQAYLEGAKNPLAPGWLAMMAAQVVLKANAIDTSKMIWSNIYNSTPNPAIRKSALQHLEGLQATQDIDALNQLAEKYRAANGHFPASMQALVDAGLVRSTPVDPTGFPYVYDSDGAAHLNPNSEILLEVGPRTPPSLNP
ncbi:MAG: hypothetical protein WA823_09965 [Candidatus Acidiferrales bacterium]